ncbi:flagellar basal-body MS-ring/collar protein FliF [Campylobacter lari]|uniref:flagellar basal-body MS-ring/collar protein FliF n=1 Tax=Campylobacter lari TaxID=201 RepID=UPI00057FA32F|nr:flagellar basal-body MS-ring/collar protein FliF [Campylobacter lari]AJD03870.1 flagellar MS-ring protein [Campylobacter lari CCUG 22395]EAK0445920.1 flagellar basal body M-ring protein FliF [Campylobacter lari]EAK0446894.1 flagellar basal body M-ring protein FliF [Campylobacter lari]MCR6547879.1 flagellar M-ring protein FliF [Campylobacter lari]MCR6549578.1 flagellar M-ring protein FliF [Campylobacter lari]
MDYKTILHQVGQLYQNLSLRQRIIIAASIVVVVGFLVFLTLFRSGSTVASEAGYSVLFENANTSDSAMIVTQLEKSGVPYILRDEGTILVPNEQVYKQRLAIASAGLLPKDNKVGFELFDKQEFGATEAEQKVKYQRALEGELARTIESLEPIHSATVHIAFAKDTLFTQQQVPPTASVALTIKEGLKLNKKQIMGIKNLIASSVTKLTPENVKIMDQKGIPLDDEGAFESDLIAAQIKYKRDQEYELEQKIVASIAPFAGGYDRVVAKVSIDYDFSKEESQSEVYDPNTVVRSEQTLEEHREGYKDKEIQGVPGAVSNIGPVEGLDDKGAREVYTKNQTTTNNEISKKITNTTKQFATVKRISAAVVVDGKYKVITDDQGNITNEYIPLSDKEIQAIENLTKGAIGFNLARGDAVEVNNLEFHRTVKVENKVQTFYSRFIEPFIPPVKYVFAAILLFIFYKKVIVPFSQKMLADIKLEEEMEGKDGQVIDDAEDAIEKFNAARKKVEEQLGFGDNFDEDALQYDVLLEKLRAVANEKGEEVALLLQKLVENEAEFGEKDI